MSIKSQPTIILSELDIIQIQSALQSIERFLELVQMCPEDDMPERVVLLLQASAAICTLKCSDIGAVLEGRAVHMVREAGEA